MEGTSLMVLGSTKLPLLLGTAMFSSEIVIADGLTSEGILSLDFVESHHCVMDTSHRACSPVWGHRLNCTIVQSHNTDLSTVCDNTA